MKRRAIALLAALCGVLFPAPAAHAAAPRVVALTPFTAATITRLGVRPVAIGETLGGSDPYLATLKHVPVLKLSHPLGPNLEQLATYNPTLVLSSKAWARGTVAMRQLGIKVYESDPTSVAQVGTETRTIGRLVGRGRQAAALATRLADDVKAATAGIAKHPSVLLILGVGRTPYAMLANSWGGSVVSTAGGRLLTAGLTAPSGTARISDELIVKRNPDVIIAVPHGDPGSLSKLAVYYRDNPNWKGTAAVRNHRVYVATGNQLLQPYSDVAATIRGVRSMFLHN